MEDYNIKSNSELKIKMIEIENEYNSIKNNVVLNLKKLEELDKKYNKIKEIYNKRTKGKVL